MSQTNNVNNIIKREQDGQVPRAAKLSIMCVELNSNMGDDTIDEHNTYCEHDNSTEYESFHCLSNWVIHSHKGKKPKRQIAKQLEQTLKYYWDPF